MIEKKRNYNERLLANARQLDRRECFADSMDGLNAHVIFGMLLDERANHTAPDAVAELVKKAQAVVDRWDTPAWKDVPHTAEFINDLRAALAKHSKPGER